MPLIQSKSCRNQYAESTHIRNKNFEDRRGQIEHFACFCHTKIYENDVFVTWRNAAYLVSRASLVIRSTAHTEQRRKGCPNERGCGTMKNDNGRAEDARHIPSPVPRAANDIYDKACRTCLHMHGCRVYHFCSPSPHAAKKRSITKITAVVPLHLCACKPIEAAVRRNSCLLRIVQLVIVANQIREIARTHPSVRSLVGIAEVKKAK